MESKEKEGGLLAKLGNVFVSFAKLNRIIKLRKRRNKSFWQKMSLSLRLFGFPQHGVRAKQTFYVGGAPPQASWAGGHYIN
jgi:hypothetical protein